MAAKAPIVTRSGAEETLTGNAADWRPVTSGQAELRLSVPASPDAAPALRLDWDFHGAGGFVVARRLLRRPLADDFAVNLQLRGSGGINDLEIKLVDAAGDSVWRCVLKGLRPPARWRTFSLPARLFEFAWGPASGGRPQQLGALEFALVAAEGGQGWLAIRDLQIVEAPPPKPPRLRASSYRRGHAPAQLLEAGGWRARDDDPKPWIELDLQATRELGGVILDWLDAEPSPGFRLRSSADGKRWRDVHQAPGAGGVRSYVYLPDLRCRHLRLELQQARPVRLQLQAYEFSRSLDAFWQAIAAQEPRGALPRTLLREQSYWTLVGAPDGQCRALLDEQGVVEPTEGSFSIEPMLWLDGQLHTWADVQLQQHLVQGWMPLPTVRWQAQDWSLTIAPTPGAGGDVQLRYTFEDTSGRRRDARLFVLLRPFQVTPPWQAWRGLGGLHRIAQIAWSDGAVQVGGVPRIVPVTTASGFGASRFDEGLLVEHLRRGELPPHQAVEDDFGFASAALCFDLEAQVPVLLNCVTTKPAESRAAPESDWSSVFDTKMFAAPGWAAEAIRSMLSAGAQILAARDGAALQPGTRRYQRSWIRDGGSMAAALLRLGRVGEAADYLRWYVPYQRADGFVPCCVDREGPDWLVEHDSHGQLIALLADIVSFSQDDALLQEAWPAAQKAAACIEVLIDELGLLPISASHEGYLAQPVHSYWDDFWAVRGLRDATLLAQRLGDAAAATRWQALEQRLSAALFASIEATRARAQLDFIPGSLEWADLDPSATAKALSTLDLPTGLDRAAVERTFEGYLADWRAKRRGEQPWTQYSAYEIRIIDTLVRLGWREAALELLRFFLEDRRPQAWNQWPEITWRDPRAPGHLGDLPHCWIAAEYVLAVRSLFVFESETQQALVLAAGLAPEWLDGEGVTVRQAPTAVGRLSYSMRRVQAQRIECRIEPGVQGRLLLRPPLSAPILSVAVEGVEGCEFDAQSVTIAVLPPQRAVILTLSLAASS